MDPVNSEPVTVEEVVTEVVEVIEKPSSEQQPEQNTTDDQNQIENPDEEPEAVDGEPPKKRGRGRPPKDKSQAVQNQTKQPEVIVLSPQQASTPTRPRRHVTPKVDANYVYANNAGPSSASPTKEEPPKQAKGGAKRRTKSEQEEAILYEANEVPIIQTAELINNQDQIVHVQIVQANGEEIEGGQIIATVEEEQHIENQEEQPAGDAEGDAVTEEAENEEYQLSEKDVAFPEGYLPTDDKRLPKKVYMKDPSDPLRRFRCPYAGCTYVAKYRSNLWDHKKTHTGEKPYQCTWPDCNMRFSQTHQLKLHTRSHTGERPYKCTWPGCDAAFSQKPGLRSHRLTHTGEKSFACDYPGCNWSFRLKGALTDHKRAIHENKKMHVCEWPGCEKRFLQNCHLKKHLMAHADIKPFACDWPKCTYKAVTMAYVTNHRRTHTGERNHECTVPGCNKKFVKSSHVNRHRQRCHPEIHANGEDVYSEQEQVHLYNEEGEFAIEQDIQNDIIQTEDNENLAENDQIIIEYSEQENQIIIQQGNTHKVYKGQLVEDKEGRQYIISGDEMIPLHDIINDEQMREVQEVYIKDEEVEDGAEQQQQQATEPETVSS